MMEMAKYKNCQYLFFLNIKLEITKQILKLLSILLSKIKKIFNIYQEASNENENLGNNCLWRVMITFGYQTSGQVVHIAADSKTHALVCTLNIYTTSKIVSEILGAKTCRKMSCLIAIVFITVGSSQSVKKNVGISDKFFDREISCLRGKNYDTLFINYLCYVYKYTNVEMQDIF